MSSPARRGLSLAFLLPFVALFIWTIHGVAMPVALGCLFAVILRPLVDRLGRRAPRMRGWAPGIVLTVATFGVLLPMAFVVLMSVLTLKDAQALDVDELRQRVSHALADQFDRVGSLAQRFGWQVDEDAMRQRAVGWVENLVRGAGESLGHAVASTPDLVVSTFLLVFALYAFLRDGPRAADWLGKRLPFGPSQTRALFESLRNTVRGVVLGSILTGLLQSALCLVALLMFRVPGAFVWSILAFVLSFLPMIGTTPVTMGAGLYLLLAGHWGMALGMGAAAVVIGTADNLVRPLVQGAESDMHPLLTLMAIFGGLETMGAGGVFMGPVIAALAQWGIETYAHPPKSD